jgi:hypothetical protein
MNDAAKWRAKKISALSPGRERAPLGCRWVLRVERRLYFGTILLFNYFLSRKLLTQPPCHLGIGVFIPVVSNA